MTVQNVTIGLSDTMYQQVKQRARRMQRSIEEEVVAVVEDALPFLDTLPVEISGELDQMAYLTDDELWNAARSSTTVTENQRMQALLLKQQDVGLSPDESAEAENLAQHQERVMLLHARAVALLKDRGQDESNPLHDR